MIGEHWVELKSHPSMRPEVVQSIAALVRRSAKGELKISYRLDGDFSRIRISPRGAPGVATQLWRHTCFEAFVAMEGSPAYHEFNFAPSGEWAAYAFRGYRNGGPLTNELIRPRIAVRSAGHRLELEALVRLNLLSGAHTRARLRIGLAAVVEAAQGLSYWALRHPIAKPDFHDDRSFTLVLEPKRADL